eukprot:1891318-Rhodomonas_salina.1
MQREREEEERTRGFHMLQGKTPVWVPRANAARDLAGRRAGRGEDIRVGATSTVGSGEERAGKRDRHQHQ